MLESRSIKKAFLNMKIDGLKGGPLTSEEVILLTLFAVE